MENKKLKLSIGIQTFKEIRTEGYELRLTE